MKGLAGVLILLTAGAAAGWADSGAREMEDEAARISGTIQERHLPFGTILDPVFAAPGSEEIAGYSRAGDSAIWTGHYLAAESFRYAVTDSRDALENAKRTLEGIRMLATIAGTGLLARAAVPKAWEHADGILREERRHGSYSARWEGRDYRWIANTSRDQYAGVFFGLGVAYELLDDAHARRTIEDLVTSLLDFLLDKYWFVAMPDGRPSTLFHLRPDQQLAFLQIGRRTNAVRFERVYRWSRLFLAPFAAVALAADTLDGHYRYFKFNLSAITSFHLIGLEEAGWPENFYRWGYGALRRKTAGHGNAHFNMIDRAVNGPNTPRDAETAELLAAWLKRPRRDPYVDLRDRFEACGDDRACRAIPAELRVTTDFLWQRSPYLLYGGGHGTIEGAGIDFILPYWMARHYGVLAGPDGDGAQGSKLGVRAKAAISK